MPWIKATETSGQTVFLNLALVRMIAAHKQGTIVEFGLTDKVTVTESPESLLGMAADAMAGAGR